jgi:hypothetical protein
MFRGRYNGPLFRGGKMSTGLVAGMAKKTQPLRIEEEALRLVRIAAGYTGENPGEYASRVLAERAREDIERGHKALQGGAPPAAPKGRTKRGDN